MSGQFNKLRADLREAGCSLGCALQTPLGDGGYFEIWHVQRPDQPIIQIAVIDRRKDGYTLFLPTTGATIDADFLQIMAYGETAK